MSKSKNNLILLSLLFLFFVPIFGLSGGIISLDSFEIRKILANEISRINDWKIERRIVISIALTIGIFGVISVAVQKFEHKAFKGVTVVLGIVISSLTVVDNTLYQSDHVELGGRIHHAEMILKKIDILFLRAKSTVNKEEKSVLFEQLIQLVGELQSIGKVVTPYAMLTFIPTLYAGKKNEVPNWTMSPPKEKGYVYFVGIGISDSLRMAQEIARIDAMSNIISMIYAVITEKYVASSLPCSGQEEGCKETISKTTTLTSSAVISGVKRLEMYYERNEERREYRVFSLFRISEAQLNSSIELRKALDKNE